MRSTRHSRAAISILSGLVIFGWLVVRISAQSVWILGDFKSYVQGHLEPGQVHRHIPGALWQDEIDPPDPTYYSPILPQGVAVGTQTVFYVRRRQIIARTLQQGKLVWRNGGNLAPAILLSGNTAFAATKDGMVLAFDARNGRRLWSTRTGVRSIDQLSVVERTLLANSGNADHGLVALTLVTGARLWAMKALEGYTLGPATSARGTVLVPVVYGEPQRNYVRAIRIRDGRMLWEKTGWFPMAVRGNEVYIRNFWFGHDLDIVNRFQIDVRNLTTGALIRSFTYDLPPISPNVRARFGDALINHDTVYLDMGCAVYRLRLGQSNPTIYGIRGTACANRGVRQRAGWLAGPYRNRLILWDGQNPYSLDLSSRKTNTYSAVRAKVSRLLLDGDRIYVGQSDGWFRILELDSGAELLRAQIGARNFDIKVRSGFVVVQAENRLIVFRNP